MSSAAVESGPSYSEKLARFVTTSGFGNLSAAAVGQIKDCILDQIGCQLIASALPWNRIVYDYACEHGAPGPCTIAGSDRQLSILDAAFVNATFGHGCELDDFGHAGAATVPVAFALAEGYGASGQDVIGAIALGYEVHLRIYEAIMPQLIERGFHNQCVIGTFSAAAVAGKMLRLTEAQMAHAYGIAASHSSGTNEYDQGGGDVKRMHAGLGARGGLQAALLAKRGLTAPRRIFESTRGGIFHTFVDGARTEKIDQGLGETFAFPSLIIMKMWPTLGGLHSSIDAIGQLLARDPFTANDVKSIKIGVQAYTIKHGAGIVMPTDVVSAQFSLAYSVALRIVTGGNDLPHYTEPKYWSDPAIAAIAHKVEAYVDPTAAGKTSHGSRMTVELNDGRTLEMYQPYRKGSLANPATSEELDKKYRFLAGHVLDKARIDDIAGQVARLDDSDDVRQVIALLRTPA
jgi:2-methylcitrate dehydratase PrpD